MHSICDHPIKEKLIIFIMAAKILMSIAYYYQVYIPRDMPACLTYSSEKYEPCFFDNGTFHGTPEEAFDTAAVYLQD